MSGAIDNRYQNKNMGRSYQNFKVNEAFYRFMKDEVLDEAPISVDTFFEALVELLKEFTQPILGCLEERSRLQKKIDVWLADNKACDDGCLETQKRFLEAIGYLLPEPASFVIDPGVMDDEIARLNGPQLVTPVSDRHFLERALEARWGSLYDAVYVSDLIEDSGSFAKGKRYNPIRGEAVVKWCANFLDQTIPLVGGSYALIDWVEVEGRGPLFHLQDGKSTTLSEPTNFVAYGENRVLFKHHGLHIELQLKANGAIVDVVLESALSSILDFEDSVATVSVEEKIAAYRNLYLIGLGSVSEVQKLPDSAYKTLTGEVYTLAQTPLLLVRNTGHHMFCKLMQDDLGDDIAEGVVDALMTGLISLISVVKGSRNAFGSTCGNSYVVKPKMHSPEEVALTCKLFARVETVLGLNEGSIKIGIMDEERRMSANLGAAIFEAKNRICFINTGFLDRSADEIYSSSSKGLVMTKEAFKTAQWNCAYEGLNVATGLRCGFHKRAQIGKGMWPKPDAMKEMVQQKIVHLQQGASCAWVPSPRAATLHAMHYHAVDVNAVRTQEVIKNPVYNRLDLLAIPLQKNSLSQEEVSKELFNNACSILGYVERWVGRGIGCSKIGDAEGFGFMEDRATLRFSSQYLFNWLRHGLCSAEDIESAMMRAALLLDERNKDDSEHQLLSAGRKNLAYAAALDLIFKAGDQPSGYTEYILNDYRARVLDKSLN